MVVVLEVGIVFFIPKITTYKSYTVMWAVAMYHITHPILTYYLFIVSNVYLAGDTSLKSKKLFCFDKSLFIYLSCTCSIYVFKNDFKLQNFT